MGAASTTRLDLLISLGHDLLAIRDLPTLLDSALQRATAYTGHDSGSILLYDQAENSLEVRACVGDPKVHVGMRVPNLQRSVAGHVLTSGQPLVLQGLGEQIGVGWRDYTRHIPSVVCLPLLVSEQRAIGVLVLKSTVVSLTLASADIEALQILAAQLAAVIENAQLHAERNQLLAELAERERRLQEHLVDLLDAQEDERRRLAYELHDGLAQIAASTYQHLQALSARYRPRAPAAREDLNQAIELARRTVREARYMMSSLRPTALDDLGLTVALRLEVEALCSKGWEITFEELEPIGRLPSLLETTLFRVCQELLTNVRKHAGSRRAHIRLSRCPTAVRLVVQDWGKGYQEAASGRQRRRGEQMGLRGIRERVDLLGGTCLIDSEPGSGTVVSVSIPISA